VIAAGPGRARREAAAILRTFDALDDHTFHWIGERSRDGGKTWRRIQDMAGRRITAPG
jgi:hypothetical protein